MIQTFLSIITGFGICFSILLTFTLSPQYKFFDSSIPVLIYTMIAFGVFFILLGMFIGNLRQILLGVSSPIFTKHIFDPFSTLSKSRTQSINSLSTS